MKTKTPSAQPPAGALDVGVRQAEGEARDRPLREGGRPALERLLAADEYGPVIDGTYRLEDVVEAHRYVETRPKTGNVVLSLNGGPR